MTNYWLSWYGSHGAFTLHWPWWISGAAFRGDEEIPTICAAVQAVDEEAAKEIVRESLDEPVDLEWRFVNPREDDWSPYSGRFPRAKWMPDWPSVASR